MRIRFTEQEIPYMDCYIRPVGMTDNDKKRGAVLIYPGGGYCDVSPREGDPIAMAFGAAGFHTFVLEYRVAPHKHPDPICDAAMALAYIREHAEEWNVDPDQIAVCGFSAGGHLAASLGVHWNKAYLAELLGKDNEAFRPNAMILGYPVITSGEKAHRGSFDNLVGNDPELLEEMSLEKQVSKDTPPAFLWHTSNDQAVPVENSLYFSAALSASNIPFECHIFPDGPHGLSLATKELNETPQPECQCWIDLAIDFLKRLWK